MTKTLSSTGRKLKTLPLLPLRDIVVFPHMIVPLFVGRDRSVAALAEIADKGSREIILVTQREADKDNPSKEDLYQVGVLAHLLQFLKLPDGTVKVLVEGVSRVRIDEVSDSGEYFNCNVTELIEQCEEGPQLSALMKAVNSQFEEHIRLNKKIPAEVLTSTQEIQEPGKLVDSITSYFSIKISEKQRVLEILDVKKRIESLLGLIESENTVLNVERKIRTRVKKQMEKTQREYYLNEQMKAINKELGDGEEVGDELQEYDKKIKNLKLSKEAELKAKAELKKLRQMNAASAESTVIRNYLDWLLGIPWKTSSKTSGSLKKAEDFLNTEHHGLEKVKERIIEHLAVQSRVGKVKGQIICLVGPPGVGKTSLAKSIAKATGRKYVRMALGGVRDESEIRGHRRTYIGSMPGKIIQGMKKAKSSNPLFLLDEIDKMGADWRGDPASALLEVLDPEQNVAFNDHYLEVDYDLSDVMFVTTANSLKMPAPLLDRMEIIRIPGYTESEKQAIAEKHLLKKQMKNHGLSDKEFFLEPSAILELIRTYTREAGVRGLERELANLSRKVVRALTNEKQEKKSRPLAISITKKNLSDYAGVPKFRFGQAEKEDSVGLVTGLAWTEVGGEMLSIEAVVLPGKGKTMITGKLGDVMQESAQAALSYVRARSLSLGITPVTFEKKDVHIHVPEGAIPKDGPSAGITMCTALVSAFTGIPVHKSIAMTGEVTLRGNVLPIGGLKEKLLAAQRAGIKTVLIPIDNKKDLVDVPETIKKGMKIIPVAHMDEVLKIALTGEPRPIEWQEPDMVVDVASPTSDNISGKPAPAGTVQ